MTFRLLHLALAVTLAASAFAGQPNLEFGPDEVTILDLQPGTKVAWMSLTRTRVANHALIRIDRGIEVAKPSNKAAVARVDADKSRSIWVVAAIDEDVAGSANAPRYSSSPFPIAIRAAAGSSTIHVISPAVELMYVRPKRGAWFISATDGGLGDSDGVQDTTISISLTSLETVQGNPQPPVTAAPDDLILMIDPRSNRTTVSRVRQ